MILILYEKPASVSWRKKTKMNETAHLQGPTRKLRKSNTPSRHKNRVSRKSGTPSRLKYDLTGTFYFRVQPTPFHIAISNSRTGTTKRFDSADLNRQGDSSRPPRIDTAIRGGRIELTQRFLNRRIDSRRPTWIDASIEVGRLESPGLFESVAGRRESWIRFRSAHRPARIRGPT